MFHLFNDEMYISHANSMKLVTHTYLEPYLNLINVKGEIIDPITFDYSNHNVMCNRVRVVAVFEDNELGTKQSNLFMTDNMDCGVLLVNHGLIIIGEINV